MYTLEVATLLVFRLFIKNSLHSKFVHFPIVVHNQL